MKLVRKILAGVVASSALTSAAMAADVLFPAPAPAPAPIVQYVDPGFDFAGAYMGTFVGVGYPYQLSYGVQHGFNFVRGNFLFGVEIETSHYRIGSTLVDAALAGRAGFLLGNRALVYGQAGIGTRFASPVWTFAGGIEVGMTHRLSLFAEYQRNVAFGGGFQGYDLKVGVNLHAGNGATPAGGDGFAGLYFGGSAGYGTGAYPIASAGVQAGYNLALGSRFITGVEVETTYHFISSPVLTASLNGRAGVTLGRALVYGEAGIGVIIANPTVTAGGGVEFAINNRMSVFGEGQANFQLGGGYIGTTFGGGMNLHFGR